LRKTRKMIKIVGRASKLYVDFMVSSFVNGRAREMSYRTALCIDYAYIPVGKYKGNKPKYCKRSGI
jgi:hypothetical protein